MVWKARLDLPEPDGPVRTTSLPRGRSRSTPWRLWVRAPRRLMMAGGTGAAAAGAGTGTGARTGVAAGTGAGATGVGGTGAVLRVLEAWLMVHVPERGR